MSEQLYNEVGVMPPLAEASVLKGCTFVVVKGDGTNAYSQGDVVKLTPAGSTPTDYSDFNPDATEVYTVGAAAATLATEAGASAQCSLYGVLVADLAADGVGYAVTRGLVLANIDTTTTVNKNQALMVGVNANLQALGHFSDLTTTHYGRFIAYSRRSTAITSGDGEVLSPVLFNGVEGFGLIVGIA